MKLPVPLSGRSYGVTLQRPGQGQMWRRGPRLQTPTAVSGYISPLSKQLVSAGVNLMWLFGYYGSVRDYKHYKESNV